ncbi:MAG: PAS domain S-box protein [Candidatus Omnitrophica bacterium]|nr:PAS domain S-box protein [Candidatus Omnitrophota bacterium]
MFIKLINWMTLALFSNHDDRLKQRLVRWSIFLVPTLSIIFVASLGYREINRDLSELVLQRRQSLTRFAASALEDKFDRMTEVGMSLASRAQFRRLIQEERWEEAIQILDDVPQNFSYIDRLFLTDPEGNMMADTPHLPNIMGKNFAFRDWYRGVTQQWEPYISEVYKRSAEPSYSVIAVAIPIKTNLGDVLGILVLQVKLDTLLLWSQEMYLDSSGFIYFTDQKGQIAAHPKFLAQEEIVDFSGVPAVQKALEGKSGLIIAFNPDEQENRLCAYEQVPHYRWTVVFQESTKTAFMMRNQALNWILFVYGLILVFNFFLAIFIKQIFEILQRHRQVLQVNQQRLATLVETAHDAIISADQQGNIVSWNKMAKIMFGYSAAEALGQPLTMIMPERFRQPHQAGLNRFNATGEARVIGKTLQVTGLRKTGEEFPIELSISTWKTHEGNFFTAIIRDVSERERLG